MESQYQELAAKIGLGASERIPKLFAMLANDSETELLLAMPGQPGELAEKLGRSESEVGSMIQTLFIKGLIFPSRKTDPPTWRMGRDIIQFHDATILWPEAPQEFLDLWQEWTEEEWPELAKVFSDMLPRPGMRIIPVGVTVRAEGEVLAFEDVKEIIDQADKLAVTKCTCRLVAHKCDRTLEACLQVNNAAAYAITRGTGRELTKEEALDIIKKSEEEGLIHTTFNKKSVDHVICNCCGCCCQFLPVFIENGAKVVDSSRFQAIVDPELCIGCETCLDRCYFGAIEMKNGEDQAVAEVIAEKCLGCGLCQVTCDPGAISMKEIKDKDYVPDKLM